MRIDLYYILKLCIYVGIVLVPITSIDSPLFSALLRGLSEEAAFYPFFLGMLLWAGYTLTISKKIFLPKDSSFKYLIYFIGVVLVSGIANIPDIYNNSFRDVSGMNRFLTLFMGFSFYLFVLIYIYNTLRLDEKLLKRFQITCIISFCIAGFYSVFEIGNLLNLPGMKEILSFFDSLIRGPANAYLAEIRIRSICLEPSMFGIYSAFILPWVFSGVFFFKRKIFMLFLSIYLLTLMILSASRSMYIIFLVEILLFCFFYRKKFFEHKKEILFSLVFLFVMLGYIIIFFQQQVSFNLNIEDIYFSILALDSESNLARYGTQVAAWNMFLDHPFLGVGLGQYAYNAPDYMPAWAYNSVEISESVLDIEGAMWPLVHGLYFRLLGEIGLLGFALWVGMWGRIVYKLLQTSKFYDNVARMRIYNLIISILGSLLYGFMHDSFATFNFWILMGISFIIIDNIPLQKTNKE
jgi:O-antigen ligase